MTIRVLQSDIDNGTCGDCYACPVARAIERSVGHGVDVDRRRVNDMVDQIVPMPQVARTWMEQFDWGFPVKPFQFEIDLEV